ncbi:MAG: hemin uptake protein HemP [Planctomycetaceae bacterium]
MSGEERPRAHRIDAEDICGADSAENTTSSHEVERPEGERCVVFNDIAGGTAEVIIEHEGQRYRLRATRNGRLLLNK